MLLYDLIEKCSYRDEYQKEHEQCEDCSYGDCCPRDCQSCLQYVHFLKMLRLQENMTVYIWQIAIIVNMHINMHLKWCMDLAALLKFEIRRN